MGGLQSIQNYYPSCLTSTIQGVSSTLSLTCISFHLKHQNTLTVLRESFVDLGVLEFQLGQKLKSLHFQLFHLDLLHFSDLFFPGCLLLLHKDGVSLGHPPVVRTRHGRAEGSSTCRLHVLPVSSPCPSPHPGLSVHLQALSPHHVLLTTRSLASLANLCMSHLVQIRGSRPKGNSGRSMKPCLPASGVWNARGCHMR